MLVVLEDLEDKMLTLMFNQSYHTHGSLECWTTAYYNQYLRNNSKKENMQTVTPSSVAVSFPWWRGLQLHFLSAQQWNCAAEGAVDWGVLLWPCRVVALPQNPQLPLPALQMFPQQKAQRSRSNPGVCTWPALAPLLMQPQLQLVLQ